MFLEVDVQYPEKLHEFYKDQPFPPETMEIENVEKLVPNLHDKKGCIKHILNFRKALDHQLVQEKVQTWFKSQTDMKKTKKKKAKTDFKKGLLKLRNNAVS